MILSWAWREKAAVLIINEQMPEIQCRFHQLVKMHVVKTPFMTFISSHDLLHKLYSLRFPHYVYIFSYLLRDFLIITLRKTQF